MMTKLEKSCYFVEDRISVSEISKKEYVSTENMLQNKAGICEATNLPSVEYPSSFQKNDILVSNIRPYFKKIWYAKFSGGCSNDVLVFRARRGFDSRFLYYVLSDDTFFNYVMSSAKGTKMPRGDKTAIMNYSVPDFDIEIQRKIAGILGALDDKIEVLREQNKTLEQMAQAVFQSWFVDFDIVRAKAAGLPAADVCKKYHITPDIYDLFPSAFSADNLPLGWEKKKLEDICRYSKEKTDKTSIETYISTDNMNPNYGGIETASSVPDNGQSTCYKRGNILISNIRPYFKKIWYADKDGSCSNDVLVFIPADFGNNMLYLLLARDCFFDFVMSGANGAKMPRGDKKHIMTYPVIVPQKKLSLVFEAFITPFFEKIIENSEQIRTLEQTRDTLLPQLISGKIEVENVVVSSVIEEKK